MLDTVSILKEKIGAINVYYYVLSGKSQVFLNQSVRLSKALNLYGQLPFQTILFPDCHPLPVRQSLITNLRVA